MHHERIVECYSHPGTRFVAELWRIDRVSFGAKSSSIADDRNSNEQDQEMRDDQGDFFAHMVESLDGEVHDDDEDADNNPNQDQHCRTRQVLSCHACQSYCLFAFRNRLAASVLILAMISDVICIARACVSTGPYSIACSSILTW